MLSGWVMSGGDGGDDVGRESCSIGARGRPALAASFSGVSTRGCSWRVERVLYSDFLGEARWW